MESVLHALGLAAAFAFDHWQELALACIVVVSVLNKALPGNPRLASTARVGADLLALIPMRGGKSLALLWLASKLGEGRTAALVDWLAGWLNLPLSPSVAKDASTPANVVELKPPRGFARPFIVAYLAIAVTVVGVCAFHGLYGLAAFAFAIFFGLLAVYAAGARSAAAILAVLSVAGVQGCALKSKEGRARLAQTILACGIEVGLAELDAATHQAHKVLENGKLDDGEASSALDALAAAAKPGLARCIIALIHDATQVPTPPPAPENPLLAAAMRVSYEPPAARVKRRAATWLARSTPPR